MGKDDGDYIPDSIHHRVMTNAWKYASYYPDDPGFPMDENARWNGCHKASEAKKQICQEILKRAGNSTQIG
jgi:hypothetical protein